MSDCPGKARHWYKLPDGSRTTECVNCGHSITRDRRYGDEQIARRRVITRKWLADAKDRMARGEPARETLYVDGIKLAHYVNQFTIEFNQTGERFRDPQQHEGHAHVVLSQRARVAGGVVSPKMVREIAAGRRPWVPFYETGDPLLCALGLVHLEQTELRPVTRAERQLKEAA